MRVRRAGFTLVELLVVIAIIGILVALLLPAVQAAREAARRAQCTNQLKNLTLGMINQESAYGQLPSSGWLGHWSGDPDRGHGKDQPGCWLYSILPFIEEQTLFDLGSGLSGTARTALLQQRDRTPLNVANCPSRRAPQTYTRTTGRATVLSGDGTGRAAEYSYTVVARADYAANVGDETGYDGRCLAISPSQYNVSVPNFPPKVNEFTGVSFCGTAVKLRQVTDGLSKTIALGEKWIPIDSKGGDPVWRGDDWGMFVGFQDDTVRSTYYAGIAANGVAQPVTHTPQPDTADVTKITGVTSVGAAIPGELFGSAHPGGCLFSMCDGSVDLVEFDVDAEAYRQMGARADDGIVKYIPRR